MHSTREFGGGDHPQCRDAMKMCSTISRLRLINVSVWPDLRSWVAVIFAQQEWDGFRTGDFLWTAHPGIVDLFTRSRDVAIKDLRVGNRFQNRYPNQRSYLLIVFVEIRSQGQTGPSTIVINKLQDTIDVCSGEWGIVGWGVCVNTTFTVPQ